MKITSSFLKALAATVALFNLAAITLTAHATETIIYLHNDVSGSPQAATDSSGNLLWKETYKPYGERTVNSTASAAGKGTNALYFHGKKVEALEGGVKLSYMGARYYDPSIGRFMGVDPQGFDPNSVHSFNRFAYGNNNPYKYVDPDGHSPIDVAFLIWDIGKLGVSVYSGVGVGHALADVGLSLVGVVSPVPGSGQMLKAARAADHIVEAGRAAHEAAGAAKASEHAATNLATLYKRPSGATTEAQRKSVQGKPCVDCGAVAPKQVADHKKPLVKEHYETGGIDKERMRSLDAVQAQCPTCSAKQGAEMSRYSKGKKAELGL